MTSQSVGQKVKLILSTGHEIQCDLIGFPLYTSGELVFTTSMVGYTEAMTDPSYFGQVLTFSYPLIGNYGFPDLSKYDLHNIPTGSESLKIHASAIIIQEYHPKPTHYSSDLNLHEFLFQQKKPGLHNLDTRYLTKLIRDNKKILAKIIPENEMAIENFLTKINPDFKRQSFFNTCAYDLVSQVSLEESITLGTGSLKINVLDCGVKWNIIRELLKHDTTITIIPAKKFSHHLKCDGWVISNGPGDPREYEKVYRKIKLLFDLDIPILGICLGSQLIGLAAGMKISRLSYGHRSHNQPVVNIKTNLGYLTSQNHGYVIDNVTTGWEVTYRNLNDQSIEGFSSIDKNIHGIQFHPEASAGPNDTLFIIDDFLKQVSESYE